MALSSGEQITYCMIPGMQRYGAIVQSIDTATIVLQLPADAPAVLVSYRLRDTANTGLPLRTQRPRAGYGTGG